MIHSKSYLIIEESLFPVILFLLSPIPENLGVVKYDILTDQVKLQGPVLKERNDSAVQIYIVRPELDSVQMIIDQLLLQHPNDVKDAHILFVPRRTIECDELLVEQKHLIEERIGHAWNIDDRI